MAQPRRGRRGTGERACRPRCATCCPRTPTATEAGRAAARRPTRARAPSRSAPAKRAWAGSPSFRRRAAERRAGRLDPADGGADRDRTLARRRRRPRPAARLLGSAARPRLRRSARSARRRAGARHRARAGLRRRRGRRRRARRGVAAQKNAEIRRVCLDMLGTRTRRSRRDRTRRRLLLPRPGAARSRRGQRAHGGDADSARHRARRARRARSSAASGATPRCSRVAQSVDEAREAMTIARRMFGGGRVMPYDDLGIYPLLHRSGATREEWRAFATRVLEPLRAVRREASDRTRAHAAALLRRRTEHQRGRCATQRAPAYRLLSPAPDRRDRPARPRLARTIS